MKKATLILGAFLTLFIVSCEGPEGLPGIDGQPGRDGLDGRDGLTRAKVIDVEGTFSSENEFRFFYEFSADNIEVFEDDVVLTYLLFDQTEDNNGDPVDIWRLMPQTRIVDQGLLQYNSEYTFFEVDFFLEFDFDPALLQTGDTDNQIFRIAVLPGEKSGKSNLDHTNIEAVMSHLGVSEKDIQKVKLQSN